MRNSLSRENARTEAALADNDRQTLGLIMKYLGLHPVSVADAQALRKDLIGMAQEARLRGSNLHDAIGEDVGLFCDEVLKNAKHNKAEYRMRRLADWLLYMFVWYLGDWGLCYSFPMLYGVQAGWLFVIGFASVCVLFISVHFARKTVLGYSDAARRSVYYTAAVFIAALFALLAVPLGVRRLVLFYVHGLTGACVLAAAAAVARVAYYRGVKDETV